MSPCEKKNISKKAKSTEANDKPKRPMTAYFRFAAEKRAEVKAANPDMKVTEIAKVIGQMWKDISEADKAVYQDAANKEMEEYKEKMEEWKAAHPEEKKEKKAKKEKKPAKKPAKKPVKEETEESESESEEEEEEIVEEESEESEEEASASESD